MNSGNHLSEKDSTERLLVITRLYADLQPCIRADWNMHPLSALLRKVLWRLGTMAQHRWGPRLKEGTVSPLLPRSHHQAQIFSALYFWIIACFPGKKGGTMLKFLKGTRNIPLQISPIWIRQLSEQCKKLCVQQPAESQPWSSDEARSFSSAAMLVVTWTTYS